MVRLVRNPFVQKPDELFKGAPAVIRSALPADNVFQMFHVRSGHYPAQIVDLRPIRPCPERLELHHTLFKDGVVFGELLSHEPQVD